MICPLLLYAKDNNEIMACLIPISISTIYRINSFLFIHRILQQEEYLNGSDTDQTNTYKLEKSAKIPNPIQSAINKLEANEKENLKEQSTDKSLSTIRRLGVLGKFDKLSNLAAQIFQIPEKKEVKTIKNTDTTKKGYSNKNMISIKIFSACLIVIVLDLLFFFTSIFPISLGISVLQYKEGFSFLLTTLSIAYQCDHGAYLFEKNFGRHSNASLIRGKTKQEISGALILG